MEVFLIRMIDYKGDVKAAACRLEHALTDDLESAIDRLLGYPESTPDGEKIPVVSRKIEPITNTMLLPLHALPVGMSGEVELLVLEGADVRTLEGLGIAVGSTIQSTDEGFTVNDQGIQITQALSARILIRTQ
jgi:hypothetical protein